MLHWNWRIYTYLRHMRYTSNHSDNIRPCTHRQTYWSNRYCHLYWYLHATTYMHFVTLPRLMIHSTRNLQPNTMLHWNWQIYTYPRHMRYTSNHSDNIRPCTHRQMCRSNRLHHLYWYLHATTYMRCVPEHHHYRSMYHRDNNNHFRTLRRTHHLNNSPLNTNMYSRHTTAHWN